MRVLALILAFGLAGCVQVKKPHRDTVVTVQELLDTPEAFASKNIVASGYWNAGFELSSFSDEFNPAASTIWIESQSNPDPSIKQSKEVNDTIQRILRKAYSSPYPQMVAGRLWIKCEARFDHSDAEPGYGHLGAYRSKLTITRVLEARDVP